MKRYDLGRAVKAMRILARNQDSVEQVFEIAAALPGHALLLAKWRLRATEFGRRLLAKQPSMASILSDQAALQAMPANSLGAAYLRFLKDEQIAASGLVAADERVRGAADVQCGEEQFVWNHLRDTHDLWHVVTDCKGDLIGEPALQAFMLAQLGMPSSALLVLSVFVAAPAGVRPYLVEGFIKGWRARWLFGQDWVGLLPLPLAEVRRRLRVTPMSSYTPMRVPLRS